MKLIKKTRKFWHSMGPGLITGASGDDPSGIATYSQAGAKFGLQTLWTAFLTLPLMIVVLEMFTRLSLVTSQGLATNLLKYYSKWVLMSVVFLTFPAIVFNIAADIAGMGAVAHLVFSGISSTVYSCIFTGLLTVVLIVFSYERVAALLKWLCLVLFVYCVVPFMVTQNWNEVIKSIVFPQLSWNIETLYILVAIIGTTISPYLFFWQSSMTLEHRDHRKSTILIHQEIDEMRVDINIGMGVSNLVMFFMMLTAGTVLFPAGITHIETVEQAALALKPLAGDNASLLFSLGVLGTGFLAIPVLGGSMAYLLSDTFKWEGGIDKKWYEAKRFYAAMIGSIIMGLFISCAGIDPVKSLIYTAVIYGVTCPFFIALILHMCNKKAVMGKWVNNKITNIIGSLTFLITAAAAILLIAMLFI